MAIIKGDFIDNLPKVYGLYTGGFLIFVLLMAVLEQMGVGADTIGILFVAFTVVIYATIGWLSRTMQVDAYYVAGRQVVACLTGQEPECRQYEGEERDLCHPFDDHSVPPKWYALRYRFMGT